MKLIKNFLFLLTSIVFLNIFFTKTLYAASVSVSNFPPSVIAGQQFDVSFTASDLDPSTSYYAKALGGEGFNEVDTWNNGSWLQQNASWTSMPAFTSDSSGNATVSLTAKFTSSTQTGTKEFKVRINKGTNYDSSVVNISVTAATPSPTPIPTNTATPTPTSTPSPTPTKSPTPKPSPTKSPTPKPSPTEEASPTPFEEVLTTTPPELLGLSTESSPSSEPLVQGDRKLNFPVIAILLIVSGFVCVGVPIIWSFRSKSRYNNSTSENS